MISEEIQFKCQKTLHIKHSYRSLNLKIQGKCNIGFISLFVKIEHTMHNKANKIYITFLNDLMTLNHAQ